MVSRIIATPAAAAAIRQLKEHYGPLLFHQSGGRWDGSVPVCFKKGELRIGSQDLLLGVVEGTPFYVGPVQYHYLADTDMTLDVVPGDLDRFSPESPKGVHFISQSEHPAPESML